MSEKTLSIFVAVFFSSLRQYREYAIMCILLGGDKTGKNDWYEKNVPIAERLFAEHLVELEKEKEDSNERTS